MLQNLKWTSYSIVHLEDRSDLYIWRPYLISTSCLVDKYGRGWFFHWKFCIKCVYVMWIMPDGGGEERKLPSVLLSASEFYKQWRHHTWWWLGPAGPAGEAQYSTGSAQNTAQYSTGCSAQNTVATQKQQQQHIVLRPDSGRSEKAIGQTTDTHYLTYNTAGWILTVVK